MLTVLLSGIDTLEATFKGTLGFPDELEHYRTLAQENKCPVPIQIADDILYVQPHGQTPWRYLLVGDDYHVRLSDSAEVPSGSVRLLSRGLLTYGARALYQRAAAAVAECGPGYHAGLSRIDTFIDFQGWTPEDEIMRNVVTRLRYEGRHGHDKTTETYQAGKGDLVVRLYNKTREIVSSRKFELLDVWSAAEGFDPRESTWRFESQMRRARLKELARESVGAALADPGSLLDHTLDQWELRVPVGKSSDRWERHPVWDELARAVPVIDPVIRQIADRPPGELAHLVPLIAGCYSSVAAALGLADLDSTHETVLDLITRYHEERERDFEHDVVMKSLRRHA